MKKIISIILILGVVVGFSVYLFVISGSTTGNGNGDDFDISDVKQSDELRDLQADDHVLGNKEAKNTVVVFEDLQCPACKSFEPILKALPSELKDTKVIFRHFPLTAIHKNASVAAFASEAASAQGKFWEWVDLAYQRQEKWQGEKNPVEIFVEIAKDVGVTNLEQFRTDVENKTFKERVQKDIREGIALTLPGTPSLYFNGVSLQLAGLDGIKKQVEKLYK